MDIVPISPSKESTRGCLNKKTDWVRQYQQTGSKHEILFKCRAISK